MTKVARKFDFENCSTTADIIDCVDCEHYYTGACDGNAGGCSSYKPTRKITLAEDIETIKRRQNLTFGVLCSMFCIVCAILVAVM